MKEKKCHKVRDHCHYVGNYGGAAHSICNFENIVPKKNAIAFHNAFNYGYHFIMKELAKDWKIHKLYSSNRKRSYKNW